MYTSVFIVSLKKRLWAFGVKNSLSVLVLIVFHEFQKSQLFTNFDWPTFPACSSLIDKDCLNVDISWQRHLLPSNVINYGDGELWCVKVQFIIREDICVSGRDPLHAQGLGYEVPGPETYPKTFWSKG